MSPAILLEEYAPDFQAAMTPSQLFSGHADCRTLVRGLLCGTATHPGGGVIGVSGYNAAREILRDHRRRWGRVYATGDRQ